VVVVAVTNVFDQIVIVVLMFVVVIVVTVVSLVFLAVIQSLSLKL
jgi:hypothetical protein